MEQTSKGAKKEIQHTFAICAYRESPFLESCIRSVLMQTVKEESRVLIVTSTPNRHIETLAERYAIPCYINNGESGITQDWNFAYRKSHTPYVTITHQDDIYEPVFLEKQLYKLERSRRPLIAFTDYYEIRNGEKCPAERILKIKRLMLMPLLIRQFQSSVWVRRRILSFGSPICCPSVTYVKENLPTVLFQNHYRACEDWEAWERLSRLKGEFVYNPILLMGHRIHENSETSLIIHDNKRSAEELEMFQKFWPKAIAKKIEYYYAKGQKSNRL